jgi:Carboxypeptidase regulatory-like domain
MNDMPRLTGTVVAAGGPAAWAYVQVRSLAGDFQGEVRTDADGRFLLHPMPGRWRLVAWAPGRGHTEQEIAVGPADAELQLELSEHIQVRT